jgi:hypothetical protein
MNTAEIGAYIKNPQSLSKAQVEDLKNLCETHPYSGLLHLLYLKALGNAKSVAFDSELKNYAIKIPNRELLYYLIHEENVVEVPVLEITDENSFTDTDAIFATLENEPEVAEVPELIAENQLEDHAEIQVNQPDEAQFTEPLEFVDIMLETPIDEPQVENEIDVKVTLDLNEAENLDIPVVEIVDEPAIEEQMLETKTFEETPMDSKPNEESNFGGGFVESPFEEVSWLDNTITFEGFADSQGDEIEADEADVVSFDSEVLLLGTIPDAIDGSDSAEHTNESLGEQTEAHDELIQGRNERKSFYDWLNVSPADSKTGNYEDVNKKMLQENQSTSPLKNEVEDIVFEQSESIPEKSKEKVQSLVDKFIEAEPRISRPKAEFFSPVKSAKESVSEEGIPVSETLAKIYELQGNYPKAIAVLEKLMELIPNKQATFESKIAEIKKRMDA